MSYELKFETPTIDDYIEIRLAAGLSRKSVEAATIGYQTRFVLSASILTVTPLVLDVSSAMGVVF